MGNDDSSLGFGPHGDLDYGGLEGRLPGQLQAASAAETIWVVVKIMVPFWVPIIIRPLIFRVPKKGP